MTANNYINKILIFSPHPDDVDFGASGSAAKWTEEGKEVCYGIISDGSKGDPMRQYSDKDELIKVRKEEQKKAAEEVGVKDVKFIDIEDGKVENTEHLRREIVKVIRSLKPDKVVSFDLSNLNFDNFYLFHRDHRQTAEAVFDAVYPAAGSEYYYPELIDEGLPPHQIQEMWFFATDKPDVYVDIEKVVEKKMRALASHKSQIEDTERVQEMMKKHAKEAGEENGVNYAENFRRITF